MFLKGVFGQILLPPNLQREMFGQYPLLIQTYVVYTCIPSDRIDGDGGGSTLPLWIVM